MSTSTSVTPDTPVTASVTLVAQWPQLMPNTVKYFSAMGSLLSSIGPVTAPPGRGAAWHEVRRTTP